MKELEALIDKGYKETKDLLEKFSSDKGDAPMPKVQDLKDNVLKNITQEEIDLIAEMKRPVFLVVPVTSGNRYLKALDGWVASQDCFKDMEDMIMEEIASGVELAFTYPSDWAQVALKNLEKRSQVEGDPIIGWKWAIVEGVSEVAEPEDKDDLLKDRMERFEGGIGLYEYMLLLMESMKNGETIDQNTWTVVSGEPVYNDSIAGGYFDNGYLYLQMSIIGVPYPAARFREMVFGSL